MRVIAGWSDRVLNIDVSNAIYDESGPGYSTKDDAPFATEAETRFPRAPKSVRAAFLLTGETPKPGENPRRALGRIAPSHIQFARAAVNLVWSRLMVVGFVEPYDSFDLADLDPKNPPPRRGRSSPPTRNCWTRWPTILKRSQYSAFRI